MIRSAVTQMMLLAILCVLYLPPATLLSLSRQSPLALPVNAVPGTSYEVRVLVIIDGSEHQFIISSRKS